MDLAGDGRRPTMGKGALVTYEASDFFGLLFQIRGSIFDNVLSKVRAKPSLRDIPHRASRSAENRKKSHTPSPVSRSENARETQSPAADRECAVAVTFFARVQLIIVSVLSIIAAILNAQGYLSKDNGTAIDRIVRPHSQRRLPQCTS